jgi:regulator of sigma E protease
MFWIGAIAAIATIIVVHEAGHLVVARLCKMRVDRFSIGFGPGLLKWRRGDTTYQIAPLFFGGYVQIRGMNPAEDVDPNDPHLYPHRPVWQRFATIFAGPGTNYLFASVLAFGLFAAIGVPSGNAWYGVHEVNEGFDAQGKLERGDRIIGVDGEPVYLAKGGEAHTNLADLVAESEGEPLSITVLRNGGEVTVQVEPRLDEAIGEDDGGPRYRLGIVLAEDAERVSVGVIGAAGRAVAYPVEQTKVIVSELYKIATREVQGEVVGPVGITEIIKDHFEAGLIYLIQLMMLLNVYIGLINLLPLPALDGGRLAFLAYEMTTRRRPNPRVEATVHMVGILLLLVLMVLVTYRDIANLF